MQIYVGSPQLVCFLITQPANTAEHWLDCTDVHPLQVLSAVKWANKVYLLFIGRAGDFCADAK